LYNNNNRNFNYFSHHHNSTDPNPAEEAAGQFVVQATLPVALLGSPGREEPGHNLANRPGKQDGVGYSRYGPAAEHWLRRQPTDGPKGLG